MITLNEQKEQLLQQADQEESEIDQYIKQGIPTLFYCNFDNTGELRKVCVFPLKPLDLDTTHMAIREDLLNSPEVTKKRLKILRSFRI